MRNDIKNFLCYLHVERGFSKNTAHAYANDLNKFIMFCETIQRVSFRNVRHEDIVKFLSTLLYAHYSPASRRRMIACLRSFYKFLSREGRADKKTCEFITLPKEQKKIPDILTISEVEKLLEMPSLKTYYGRLDAAILEFLYCTGIRVSELCSIKIDDIDLKSCRVRIHGKGNKMRLIPLTKSCIRCIKRLKSGCNNSYLFVNKNCNAINRQYAWRMIKRYAKEAGIKKNVTPHLLRHSFATHLLENGADIRIIQQLLGHENIQSTTIYTHLNMKTLKEHFTKYHPRN